MLTVRRVDRHRDGFAGGRAVAEFEVGRS